MKVCTRREGMAKVLMLYAINEYPTRNTIQDFLASFKKYSDHKICYYNMFTDRIPEYLKQVDFDAIIFHQTITLCGNKEKYYKMIDKLKEFLSGSHGVKIALFQDEYFYTEMSVIFINELKMDFIFSVAPKEEWTKIYKGVRRECKICPMLTGYISEKSKKYYKAAIAKRRTVDIGYRVVWDKPSIALGRFGYDKLRIAKLFLKKVDKQKFRLDIKTGSKYLIKGKNWNAFLSSCRFVLGAESGSGVLDFDGSIREAIFREIKRNPEVTVKELYQKYVGRRDGNFALKAISPRHFEAIEEGVCQILYEGDYSGILKPHLHYVPLKKDHSNFEQVMEIIQDERKRRNIVNRAFQDIVASGNYTYEKFVRQFFNIAFKSLISDKNRLSMKEKIIYCRAKCHEIGVCGCLTIITFLKKKGLLTLLQKKRVTREIMNIYYEFRH